jgi:alkanesulfonate monooxygenase SsuD/methylene tetrahydromethanopterin reductase-like flavin-dependent oxidoreductase (luciferase family)
MTTVHPWVAERHAGPRFGVNMAPAGEWRQVRATAQKLEAVGIDSIFMPDHPLLMGDAWTTLAGIAEATERVRLGTMVSCVAYRHPVALARIASDVDRISNGRVVLGIGSGDMPWEFQKLGLEYGTAELRQARLAEALAIIKPLLAGEKVTFKGELFQVHDVALDPRPVQDPIPILIAGGGRQTLRLVAEYADASNLGAASWAGGAFTVDDIAERWSRLRAGCAECGRSFDSVLRTVIVNLVLAETDARAQEKMSRMPTEMRAFFQQLVIPCTPAGGVAHVRRLLDAGFQYVIFQPLDPESLELLASGVMPQFRQAPATA